MFSIIIPLYNKAAHIKKAVQSVLDQTFSQFELIIINDGSGDNGPDIVKAFSDPRIRLIDQSNSGVSTARNNGVRAATFEYIAFLDADDWWAPDYLEAMKGLIESHPEAGIYAAKYALVKNGRKTEAVIGLPEGFTSGYINYFVTYSRTMWMPLHCSSTILPKAVFLEQKGFKPDLKLGEDFELWVRIALSHPVVFLNKVLMYYNQDVDVTIRGVNPAKFHPPHAHYIYNLAQFSRDEQKNSDLKKLLDKLRAQALLKYHLHGVNPDETDQILKIIDFDNISAAIKRQYDYPKPVIRLYWNIKTLLSVIKQWFLRTFFAAYN